MASVTAVAAAGPASLSHVWSSESESDKSVNRLGRPSQFDSESESAAILSERESQQCVLHSVSSLDYKIPALLQVPIKFTCQ